MENDKRVVAIITAGGTGTRMGLDMPKQYLDIGGKSMLEHSVDAFADVADVRVITVPAGEEEKTQGLFCHAGHRAGIHIVKGGDTRTESVYNALSYIQENALASETDIVLIHDAARPFVTRELIERVIDGVIISGSAIPVVPLKDTIYREDKGGRVSIPNRDELFAVQTPQGFSFGSIFAAHRRAHENGEVYSDDGGLYIACGLDVALAVGDYSNSKITIIEDLEIMRHCEHSEAIQSNCTAVDCFAPLAMTTSGVDAMTANDIYRVGTGFDVHELVTGRKLILGGVLIEHEKGLSGHSDADVLTHALMDAILGALHLGDIGKHFPDTDAKYKGISSMKLLKKTVELMHENGYDIENADMTILAERPKLAPYRSLIEKSLAEALEIDLERVSVKATTTEGLGTYGREEGIGAQAIVLLKG